MEDWQKEYIERARRVALEQRRSAALAGSENVAGWSDTDQAIFDAYWDKIGLNEALTTVLNQSSAPGGDVESVFRVSDKDPASQQFRERFGADGNLRMSIGRPVMYGQDWETWSKDPSQIIDLGDGRFIYNEENINQDAVNRLRDADARSGLNLTPAMGVGFVLGAGMLGNALMGAEGLFGAAAEGGAAGGFPAGAGIAGPSLETAGVATGALEGGAAAGTAATTGTGLGQYAGMTTGLDGIATPSLTAGGGASNIAATTAALGGAGGGAGGAGGILGGAGEWFSNLSPMAQRAILSAAGQGASAIMSQRRQESAQDFARQQQDLVYQRRLEEEERARRERELRGTPQAYQFNVTPRPGIVGSNMGG